MTYRVTHEFKLTGSLPSQAELDRMLARVREAAPEGDVAVALGLGRVEVSITVAAGDRGQRRRSGEGRGGGDDAWPAVCSWWSRQVSLRSRCSRFALCAGVGAS